MRIGIEAQRIFSAKKSAVDQLILELIHGLMAIDDDNEYFIFAAPGPETHVFHEAPNFHLVYINSTASLLWEQVALPREVSKLSLDLMHCTTSLGITNPQTKTLVTINDSVNLTRPYLGGNIIQKIRSAYRRKRFKSIATVANGLVTHCSHDRNAITKKYASLAGKTKTIHPGVSSHYLYTPAHLQRPARVPAQYLLYFGGLEPRKNMRNVLKGYELYSKMTTKQAMPLVIADVAEDEIINTLTELNLHKIRSKIVLAGHVPWEKLPSLYSHATLLLCPYLRDTNGMQIIEGMASDTAVLTSNTSCLGEISGRAGYRVNPFSPEAISHGIYKVLHDSGTRSRMLAKGHDRVRHFLWPIVARRYQNIYMEIMAEEVRLPFSSQDLIAS